MRKLIIIATFAAMCIIAGCGCGQTKGGACEDSTIVNVDSISVDSVGVDSVENDTIIVSSDNN